MKLIFITSFLLLISCSKGVFTTSENNSYLEDTDRISPPKEDIILIFNLEFKKDNNQSGGISISLRDKNLAEGFLKKDFDRIPSIPKDKYKISLANSDFHIIKSTIIENPLHQHVEYENDQHQLQYKPITKESSIVSFRARYEKAIEYVIIEYADDKPNSQFLKKIKL
ncbi:hypothetical protein [Aquimarina sediminis]|uniref:hypothetical protein n=1 Tax=Aquimarina sediminis TaxID=2070536 RepID=UPI000CA01893|nr:hypothetical protein [Aquimarina sediminis]